MKRRKIHCLNPISKLGTGLFPEEYEIVDSAAEADGILVRSASMHEMEFSENLRAVARAGAGVNNIPLDACAERGIVVFNTPGANANGVKELVIAGLILSSRDIAGGIEWCKKEKENPNIAKDVEKAKKAFAGHEIKGKKLGVIGLGAIGAEVANAAASLGMEVYGYDPFISVNAAWMLSRDVKHIMSADTIYKECDYITLHVPLLDGTRQMINKTTMADMKEGVVILNFARDLLVNDDDMAEALKEGKVKRYVTDFPNVKTAAMEHAIVIPHLGASTEESEDNCARMAAKQIRAYFEHGNIQNSVNYPDSDMGLRGKNTRIVLLHHNVPNMIGQFTKILADDNMNIADMSNKSKGGYAYTMIDIDSPVPEKVVDDLRKVGEVLRVRVIE